MGQYDWSTFTKRINVNASPSRLYEAWTTRAGIEEWFLRFSEFSKPDGSLRGDDEPVQKGDSYTWRWFGYPDEVTEKGSILDVNGKDYLKFSFGKAGNVAVTIRSEAGENIVELTQDQIPEDEFGQVTYHIGCGEGWTFYLANLKSMMEGGIDLRNRNEELQKVINS